MGNENEVKKQLEKTKSVFLPEEFKDPEGRNDLYSLEDEFRKSRKNRNWKFYFWVVIFLGAIVAVALLIAMNVRERGQQVKVDISSFQDLKLKELLDASQQKEGQLDIARRELSNLEYEYRQTIEGLKRDYAELKDIARSRDLNEAEKQTEIARLDRELNQKLKQADAKYRPQIAGKETGIAALLKELMSSKGELAKGDKTRIATLAKGETQLDDLERTRLKNLYEDRISKMQIQHRVETESLIRKYNPVFTEKELQAILSRPVRPAQQIAVLDGVEGDILGERASTRENMDRLKTNVNETYRMNTRMERIPYINSPGRAVIHIAAKFRDIVQVYDQIVLNLIKGVRRKNQLIKYYDYAFAQKIGVEKEAGYVLDPRDRKSIGVYLNRVHNIKEGDLGYVFRQDDQFIATVRFRKNGQVMVAEAVEEIKDYPMLPFDKITLKKAEPVPAQ